MKFFTKILKAIASCLGFYLSKIPHWFFVWHIVALAFIMRAVDRRRYKDAKANLDFVMGSR